MGCAGAGTTAGVVVELVVKVGIPVSAGTLGTTAGAVGAGALVTGK